MLLSHGDSALTGRFHTGTPFGNKIAYTSYSRSGNTFFRKLLEQTTGIFTGTDYGDLNSCLGYQLQHAGFTGEAVIDESVWFVKTHHPLGDGDAFIANKTICCVRNPLDVVVSMFHFWTTQTQNQSVSDEKFHETYAEDWKRLVK